MQRYFTKTDSPIGSVYFTTDDEMIHHMRNVMRFKENENVVLVFNEAITFLSRIQSLTDEGITFELVEEIKKNVELPLKVTIASAFPKGDKLKWITQKSTELGASSFAFFPSSRSVVKLDKKKAMKKKESLEKIAMEASEQSHRTHVPTVDFFGNFSSVCESFKNYDKVLVAYEESAKIGETTKFFSVVQDMKENEKLLLVFGPEGGFSEAEVEEMEAFLAIRVGLGPRILRAETAPMYALSAISTIRELM
ncbi:MAG: 16S rRNA (uracil(1498)-N(3))-methyltransferase [Streptococcaceae bacterium]|nr:16S rRNA (uracil(1498)-N(3))-methyltransferase [Streptococcaceae bacterium]